ncbi:hypothetical protein NY2A_b176R [Paramecium bursaria Chlorella virus NY2A]|uniref:Uncharacterized protein b176R n=1 Tax=Paramecium bursaria Chlorella virus NY2A TaxID=46021 RepID=A7IW51_PBCVN|nr:hypothetical protein NY2A_b176R [Paramecium bursaria Chlorella virus NY2A]ABT14575.1 hypothetical protein NY2A_b176R [Paramecium bursaria Chlorella virus NY2A]
MLLNHTTINILWFVKWVKTSIRDLSTVLPQNPLKAFRNYLVRRNRSQILFTVRIVGVKNRTIVTHLLSIISREI